MLADRKATHARYIEKLHVQADRRWQTDDDVIERKDARSITSDA